jgi:outer membrane murein-binding lipoprotein Lpp
MEPNQSRSIRILILVLVIFTGLLLSGCASTGKGKEAGSEPESDQQGAEQEAAVQEPGGSSAEADQQTVVYAGGSKENPQRRGSGIGAGEGGFQRYAASIRQALGRIVPEQMAEWNWRRISTVVVGLLMMSMIYGLAFALGRLPLRRGRAGGG